MIVLDSNVLLIDLKYNNDPNFTKNKLALETLGTTGTPLAVTTQVILEVVGVMSFGIPAADVVKVWPGVQKVYNLRVIPDPMMVTEHCGCTCEEIIAQMHYKQAAGDAVIAAQMAKYAIHATAFLTWNAKHFRGKLVVPVFTPEEWLSQQSSPSGNMP